MPRFTQRRLARAGVAAASMSLMVIAGACSKEAEQTTPASTQTDAGRSTAPESAQAANTNGQALVRVVNAAPAAPVIDVTADKNMIVTQVDYKSVTAYKEVPASADDFAITAGGSTTAAPLAENSESISSGRHYTLIAFPTMEPGKLELQVVRDDLQSPAEGKARVRVVNASPDTPTVAVFARGEQGPLFSDVDFKETAAYKEVDPRAATLEFHAVARDARMAREPGPVATGTEMANRARDDAADNGRGGDANTAPARATTEPTLATARVNLEAGKSYTLVLTGHQGDKGGIDTLIIEDAIPAPARTN